MYSLTRKTKIVLVCTLVLALLFVTGQAPPQKACGEWSGDQEARTEWQDEVLEDQRHPGQPGPQDSQ